MASATRTASVAFDPFSATIHENPYPTYRALRAHAPVYFNAKRDLWALSRYEDIRTAGRDWPTFAYGQGVDIDDMGKVFGAGNFLDTDPPAHTSLRRVARDTFRPSLLRTRMEPVIEREVGRMVDQLARDGGGDAAQTVAWRLPLIVVSSLLGLPAEDGEQIAAWARAFVVRQPGDPSIPTPTMSGFQKAEDYLRALVDRRRREPGPDLVSTVANAELDGAPIGGAAVGLLLLLLVASFETTAGLLANGLLLLAEHEHQRRWLAGHVDAVPAAVEEMLRFDSPVQNLKRTTTRDVDLHEVTIPAGSSVMLLYASANRDERRYERAEEFDVRRTPIRHLAFGDGIHHCLGAPLARLEGRILFETVLRRIPDYRLAGTPRRLSNHATRGLVSLPIVL